MDYCGIDLHLEYSELCILDEGGEVMERLRIPTSRTSLERFFRAAGSNASRGRGWRHVAVGVTVGRELGHDVIVQPRRVRLIAESTLKNDTVDAEVLARLVRLDPTFFLKPITHRTEEAQRLRSSKLVRRALIDARTKWINPVRGCCECWLHRSGLDADSFRSG